MYKSIGISKQAFHRKMDRLYKKKSEQKQILLVIYEIRKEHPTMGIRDLYFMIKPQTMGRDNFEQFCKNEGLMLTRNKNYARTTDSSGVIRFPNLIINISIVQINQVWQSDITYFEVKDKFYYITFIIDSFSRRIIGHNVSQRLTTEQTTLPALKMAINLRSRNKQSIMGCIFHSDGGGQYYDKEFLKLTEKYKFVNSMCEYAWENGKAERINGVIKNNYLKNREIQDFETLSKCVDHSVNLYNNKKPHINLKRRTPIEYENIYICNGQ